ncbi:MAG: SDR family NAD(P)-dependent oxidoreductase, partial [Chloroflexi bacterium]|nr:SDR family NAD(P)-dependent oxidoreductase [Chloroflexota bacterium]
MRLQGKVAIVTGASQGIGRAIAAACAREGAKVVLVARREREVKQAAAELVAAGGVAAGLRVDVSQEEDVKGMVQWTVANYGALDILVNNAGIAGPVAPIWEVDLAGWRECLDIN